MKASASHSNETVLLLAEDFWTSLNLVLRFLNARWNLVEYPVLLRFQTLS